MDKTGNVIKASVIIILVFLLITFVTMLAWNDSLTSMFGVVEINFKQTFALLILLIIALMFYNSFSQQNVIIMPAPQEKKPAMKQ